MEVFLFLNDHEIKSGVDEQEKIILALAAGKLDRENFVIWIKNHITPIRPPAVKGKPPL